jgi:hypothetical protein
MPSHRTHIHTHTHTRTLAVRRGGSSLLPGRCQSESSPPCDESTSDRLPRKRLKQCEETDDTGDSGSSHSGDAVAEGRGGG